MVSTGGMTNRVDRLERRGLIVRKPDPHDRHGVLVELTPSGTEVLAAAVRTQAANEVRLLDVLPKDKKESLGDLRKLLIHFEVLMGPRAAPPRARGHIDSATIKSSQRRAHKRSVSEGGRVDRPPDQT
jgi:hypothetical protein